MKLAVTKAIVLKQLFNYKAMAISLLPLKIFNICNILSNVNQIR